MCIRDRSWEIAEVVSPCLPRGLWSHIVIRVFLFLGTVCPWHPPYPALPSCQLSRAFSYLQPGDAGGRRSAPAVCQSLTSASISPNADEANCPLRQNISVCLSVFKDSNPNYWSKRWRSGSSFSWTIICKSFTPRSRQITMRAPHHSVFTGWMPFLTPNQQCHS